jgi:very-short-patch-repair endonuclease
MTPAEKKLWQALRGNKLEWLHFRRQQIIAGFIVDFYCHAAGLVVEIEGEIHQQQQEYDNERDKVISEIGLRVLHIPKEEVLEDLPQVLEKIRVACNV